MDLLSTPFLQETASSHKTCPSPIYLFHRHMAHLSPASVQNTDHTTLISLFLPALALGDEWKPPESSWPGSHSPLLS